MRIYIGDDPTQWVLEDADGSRWMISPSHVERAPFTGELTTFRLADGLPAMLVALVGDCLIGAQAIAELAGTDVTAVYDWHHNQAAFPEAATLRPLRWWKDEVRQWLAANPRVRGRHRRRNRPATGRRVE